MPVFHRIARSLLASLLLAVMGATALAVAREGTVPALYEHARQIALTAHRVWP
jgi:hypothetical protein